MNINASIVDQRLSGLITDHTDLLLPFAQQDAIKQRSVAFVLLCVSVVLDLPLSEAAELLTEGGNDAGVDALHLSDIEDGEFSVTLFQGKYKHKDLSGDAYFSENAIKSAIHTVANLFDPAKNLDMNQHLKPRIEEIRSLIRDGYIPNVKCVLCSNGRKWNQQAQSAIEQSGLASSQVQWLHVNHDSIVNYLQRKKQVDDSIQLHGKAVIEEFDFRRVLIGKVSVAEVAKLFSRHGDVLLERNIRRYLGLHVNRVNSAMSQTLVNPKTRPDFYFFNNGLTVICRKFRHNALQGESYQLKLEGIQVINGGQTSKTIQQTLEQHGDAAFADTYVLLRLYELADDDQNFVRDITYATNSQNPVDLRDLQSNDTLQQQLETGIQGLGYNYKRKRDDSSTGGKVIANTIAAEATLAIWRNKPHQAKFRRQEHFGKLYHTIFDGLNASQAVLAVLIFRIVENERKRPTLDSPPIFLPYAAHYLAMLMGQQLLTEASLKFVDVTHREFTRLEELLSRQKDQYMKTAIEQLQQALDLLYGKRDVSLQQLSATFRRGDLLETLGS